MSLFAKLLLWFVATVLLSVGGFAIVQRFFAEEPRQYGPLPVRVVAHLAEQAEREMRISPQALSRYLSDLESDTGIHAVLVNPVGVSMVDGSDHRESLQRMRSSRFFATISRGRLILGRPTRTGAGILLAEVPVRAEQPPLLLRPQLWWLATVLLLTYLLARHLTRPLRGLQLVAERLGAGELRARAAEDRADEFGSLARAFNRMAQRMEILVESERRLLRDVSHELRSPLARLGVAVELARTSDHPARELDIIEKQSVRLNELVSTLLDVARDESATQSIRREPVELKHLLTELADAAQVEAGAKRIVVEADPFTIRADAERLRRAIENVIRNALRYSRDDGTVWLQAAASPQFVEVQIRDEGPGVPEDALPHLFEAFFRVEGQHSPGFGLGLSIARRAVEAHGGTIEARNASPGLEVTIRLPRD